MSEDLTSSNEPALVALQGVENLSLQALIRWIRTLEMWTAIRF
jgi:hypothetical protein